jgi:hypothetical protein
MTETHDLRSSPSIESLKAEHGADVKIHSVVPAIEALLRAAEQDQGHGACCDNCVSKPETCQGGGYVR